MTKRTGWIGAVVAGAAVAALFLQRQPPVASGQTVGEDSLAEYFLESVRGASPFTCEMLVRSLGLGWGWRSLHTEPDAERDLEELVGWATGRPRDPAVVPILRAGLEDSDPCTRRVSAHLLGRTRHPDAVRSLLEALRSSSAQLRELAAVGLGRAEDREALDPLVGALSDRVPAVRAAAAWALGQIETRGAVEPLVQTLREDADPQVRRAAALALGNLL